MNHQIRPQLERALQHRSGKSIFTGQRNLQAARALGDRPYVDHFDQGIGRRLQPQKLGLRAARLAKLFDIPHVHERMLQSPAGEEPGDKLPDAKVQIPMKNDMVARRQSLKYRQACRHASAEGNRLDAALQICQALLERFSIGIIDPAIEECRENAPSGSRSKVVEV